MLFIVYKFNNRFDIILIDTNLIIYRRNIILKLIFINSLMFQV